MEDRAVLEGDVKCPKQEAPLAMFAMLDGHNGSKCVEYVKNNMVATLLANNLNDKSPFDDEVLLKKIYKSLDSDFLKSAAACTPIETSGCCTTVAIIRPYECTVAWAGDCRVVVCQLDGVVRQVTVDHHPTNELEQKRVTEAGGWIANKRVNGVIAITRSIGDIEFKTLKTESWGKPFTADLLVSEPDSITFSTRDLRFIVLASDGLFESLSNQLVVDCIAKRLAAHGDVDRAAKELIKEAEERNTEIENTTAIIVAFNCS